MLRRLQTWSALAAIALLSPVASAQTSATPPGDLSEVVKAPKPSEEPLGPFKEGTDTTNAAVSAGGQFATGNSRLVAATGTGKFDMRRGNNAFAAALIGNYSEAYVAPGGFTYSPNAAGTALVPTPTPAGWKESTENLQGKLRYDRFLSRNLSAFLQVTGTHDSFQAITFRLNIDPGVKYLVHNTKETKLWGEAGYDFQYDDNYTDSLGIEQAGAGGPSTDSVGADYLIKRNDTIHSSRLFAGLQHAFSKEVNFSMGLEYLQGFGGSGGSAPNIPAGHVAVGPSTPFNEVMSGTAVDPVDISLTGSRLNLDLLLAAKLGLGLSFGVGFTAKYNSAPLAGKEDLDTSTTLTLIYSFSAVPPKKEEPKCADFGPTPPPPPPPPASPSAPPLVTPPLPYPASSSPAAAPLPAAPTSAPSNVPPPAPTGSGPQPLSP